MELQEVLNQSLYEYNCLANVAKWYHWNVTGDNFTELHIFFGNIYDQAIKDIDLIAERLRALSLEINLESMNFDSKEEPIDQSMTSLSMIENLLFKVKVSLETSKQIIQIAIDNDDFGTQNMYGDLMQNAEKLAWMLKSFL